MTDCKNCIKADVCKLKTGAEEMCRTLSLTREYQALTEMEFDISIKCNKYLKDGAIAIREGDSLVISR